jgi:Transposase and inactivated derivatives
MMRGRYIGIDLAITGPHRAAVMDADGTFLGKSFSFDRSFDGFQELLKRAQPTDDPTCRLTCVLVPTSKTWIPLCCFLIQKGHTVFLVSPQKAADLRKYYKKHTKSDRIDAQVLAKLPLIDPENLTQLWLATSVVGSLKGYCIQRDTIVMDIADRKRRIEAHFTSLNPKLMEAFGKNKFTAVSVAFLRHFADPFKVKRFGLERLTRFLKKHAHGRIRPDLPRKIFEASVDTTRIYEQAKAQGHLPFDFQHVQDQINIELDVIEYEQDKVALLDQKIAQLYEQVDPDKALQSLRGFGPVISANIVGVVGNVLRFPNVRAYQCYCGGIPKKKQSSHRDQKGLPITKAAQRLLKKSYHMAAETSRRYDVEDAAFYDRLIKRGLHHTQAITAVARRLSARSYAVMKRVQQAQQGLRERSTVPFQLRNLDGTPLTPEQAHRIVQEHYPSKSKVNKNNRERTQAQVCSSRQSLNSSNMRPGQPLPIGHLLKDICTARARQQKNHLT